MNFNYSSNINRKQKEAHRHVYLICQSLIISERKTKTVQVLNDKLRSQSLINCLILQFSSKRLTLSSELINYNLFHLGWRHNMTSFTYLYYIFLQAETDKNKNIPKTLLASTESLNTYTSWSREDSTCWRNYTFLCTKGWKIEIDY